VAKLLVLDIVENIRTGTDLEKAASQFLSLSHDEQITLLNGLAYIRDEKLGIFLNMVYPATAGRDARKLIKKLLFRLTTLGIHVEEPAATGESVLRRIEVVREEKAFLSNYDGEAMRACLVAAEMKKNQFIFIHSVIHFSEGLVDFAPATVPGTELDNLLKDYRMRAHESIVLPPVSPRYAAYLIEEAGRLAPKYEREVTEIRPFLSSLKGFPREPGDIYRLETPDATTPLSVETILSHETFEPFALTWKAMEDDRKEFQNLLNPAILVPPYVMEERKQEFLRKRLETENVRAIRQPFKRMLEDDAYLLYCLGNFGFYGGVIDQLRDETGLDRLLAAFLQKALERKQPEQEGVLVNPFEPQKKPSR
jgi:hypothetical protein